MWGEFDGAKVYLALGPTDLRRSINGLSVLVSEVLESDPFSESWYIFCNRRRDKIKILHWQGAGFWLHYRRLERGRFNWPQSGERTRSLEITPRELRWLLDGLPLEQPRAHRPLHYQVAG
jgi:transposase